MISFIISLVSVCVLAFAQTGEAVASQESSLQIISETSSTMITWALSILGGSILAVLSTSYLKPASSKWRFIYLMFLPGWFFVGKSIYYGNLISRSRIAESLVKKEFKVKIGKNINTYFDIQLDSFNIGLSIFILWLIILLVLWIFTKHFDK